MLQEGKIAEGESITFGNADLNAIKDAGFSVHSDAHFLYLIGKMCVRANEYLDLAVQCLNDYLNILGFYRDFEEQNQTLYLRTRALVLLAQAFLGLA